MHLSHLYEDLETWYEKNFPKYTQQVQAMQYPGVTPAAAPTHSSPRAKVRPGGAGSQAATTLRPQWSLSVVDSTAIEDHQQLR